MRWVFSDHKKVVRQNQSEGWRNFLMRCWSNQIVLGLLFVLLCRLRYVYCPIANLHLAVRICDRLMPLAHAYYWGEGQTGKITGSSLDQS